MRVLLLGDHPDGVALAEALVRQGKHQLAVYAGPAATAERLASLGIDIQTYRDAETALALADIAAVIVADELAFRPAMLRRALQSEKHVLCVHPADVTPDIAYEAMMIQQDTHKQLVPLLPERVTPGQKWLREQVASGRLGRLQSVEIEQCFASPAMVPSSVVWEGHPLLSVWDVLRQLGGEVQDLSAVATSVDMLQPTDRVTLTGRFAQGELFQVLLLPQATGELAVRVTVRGDKGEAGLDGPFGWFGECYGRVTVPGQPEQITTLPAQFRPDSLLALAGPTLELHTPLVSWTDATRCLELFDAARRSVKRRRVVPMDYEAQSEAGNFKSFMTAFGCLTLLAVIVLFFMTPTFPWSKYLIPVLLTVFLGLQGLRWVIRDQAQPDLEATQEQKENPSQDVS